MGSPLTLGGGGALGNLRASAKQPALLLGASPPPMQAQRGETARFRAAGARTDAPESEVAAGVAEMHRELPRCYPWCGFGLGGCVGAAGGKGVVAPLGFAVLRHPGRCSPGASHLRLEWNSSLVTQPAPCWNPSVSHWNLRLEGRMSYHCALLNRPGIAHAVRGGLPSFLRAVSPRVSFRGRNGSVSTVFRSSA